MYCSVEDVIHEVHPTLKLEMEHNYAENFESVILAHIVKAEAFVNASLSRAYNVPLKKATSIVVSAECKIAAYFAAAAFTEKEEILIDKYQIAKEILDNLVLADNPALVDEGLTDEEALNENIKVRYGSDDKLFTTEELELW